MNNDLLFQQVMADYGQYMSPRGYADGGQVPAHEANLAAWEKAQADKAAQWEALKQKDMYQPGIAVVKEGNQWVQNLPAGYRGTESVTNPVQTNMWDAINTYKDPKWVQWYQERYNQGYRYDKPLLKSMPVAANSITTQASAPVKLTYDFDPSQYNWNEYGQRLGRKPVMFGSSMPNIGLSNTYGENALGTQNAIRFANGGYVRGYAEGDLVEIPDQQQPQDYTVMPPQLNQAPSFAPIAIGQVESAGGGYAPPVAAPTSQLANINPELYALMQQYTSGPDYSADLRKVGQERQAAEASFNKALEGAMAGADEGPSKAELYFRLAAAFGTPSKTGAFGEGLAQAAGAAAEHKKEERTAQTAKRKLATEILLKKQELALEGVKDREKTLLALQSENSKDRREAIKGIIKDYIDSGKPQSEAGKIAKDKGFTVGTKEYQDEVDKQAKVLLENKLATINATLAGIQVQQGRLALETKKEERAASELDPSELKLLSENKQALRSTDSAMALMDEALTLADKAFTKSTADQAEYKRLKTTNPNDPRVVATEQLEQILTTSGLAGLRASFGGNPTEGERNVQLLTQGLGASSTASRRQIITRVKNGLLANRKFYTDSNNELLSGEYKKKPVTSKE